MATHNIKTKTARAQLAYQKNPYWSVVSSGLAVGYSVPVSLGEGSWHLRVGASGTYRTEKIPSDIFVSTLNKDTKFDQACAYARENKLRLSCTNGAPKRNVSALAAAYLAEKKRLNPTQPEKTRRLESYISRKIDRNKIGLVLVSQISRIDIEAWLTDHFDSNLKPGTVKHKSACASANRSLAQLKAILNWSLKNMLISNDDPWAQLKKYTGVSQSRNYIPSFEDFEAVRSKTKGVLNDLMIFLIETGMRPGEPLKLKVKDINHDLRIAHIPEDTKTGKRSIKVSPRALKILLICSANKSNESYIFGGGDKPMDSCLLSKKFRIARRAAGADEGFVLYSLRHAWITNAIKQRSPMEVAKYAGTSMQMIESFYLKFDSGDFIDSINSVFPGDLS